MFEKKVDKSQANESAEKPVSPEVEGHVYTMPEKFMPAKHFPDTASGKKKWFIIGGVILAVLIIVTAIIVYAFSITNVNSSPQPQGAETVNNSLVPTNDTNSAVNVDNTNTSGGLLNIEDSSDDTNVNTDVANPVNTTIVNTNTALNANTNSSTTSAPDRSDVPDSADTDKDGLTDEEEEIYGTVITLPDTDKDGFIDGTELVNLYSPTDADKKLIKSEYVLDFSNTEFSWLVYYPASWVAESLDATERQVIFTPDTVQGEVIQIVVTDNPGTYATAAEWYASLYEDVEVADLDTVMIGEYEAVHSIDGLNYYLMDDNYIVNLSYTFGDLKELHFRSTFQMMVNSFSYTPAKAATPKNANQNEAATNTNNTNTTNTSGSNTNNTNTNTSNANTSNTNTVFDEDAAVLP